MNMKDVQVYIYNLYVCILTHTYIHAPMHTHTHTLHKDPWRDF